MGDHGGASVWDVTAARAEFPALIPAPGRPRLSYLDSASSTLRPRAVLDALAYAHAHLTAGVHRGVYELSQRSTDAYEDARAKVARFFGAQASEIVFVRNTTEALNLVAQAWARPRLRAGDEIVITELEHHSNWLPWQAVARFSGARLVVIPVDASGTVTMDAFAERIGARTRVVALAHVSNVLGVELPVREVVELAHAHGAVVVVDGAQAVPHLAVDVKALGCDFYAASGHKVYGPSGAGVLFGRSERLAEMEPYQVGGGMVASVGAAGATFLDPPQRFEAGTPDVASAIGLGAAVEYLRACDRSALTTHERRVLAYAERVKSVPGVRLLGSPRERVGVLSFVLDGVHPHDLGTVADTHGVAIRTGHHCAQPLLEKLGLGAAARLSVALYNDTDDIDALVDALHHARALFA
ncbi:MAG: aminotransferase class V-fold PLP-dependent enzyme [Polyangiales bacterium]